MATRIIPKANIEGLRFGQLLINALDMSGHLEPIVIPRDINDEKFGEGDVAYVVKGVDLFYLKNDKLETILQDFLKNQQELLKQ